MIFILELGLCIAAYFRGWKGWASLPLTIGYGGAFCIGVAVSTMPNSDQILENLGGVFALMDIGIVIALIIMVAKKHE